MLKKILAVALVFSFILSGSTYVSAKTATYKGKKVTYKYEMMTVPYGATNYLEACKAKMTYPSKESLKIKGTITGKRNGKTSTTTYTDKAKSTSCTITLTFDVPGYDITHYKGIYTIGEKSYTIDTKIV